jgi:hypothetical protein
MQTPNILPPGQSGNSHRGESAALPANRFQILHADLSALAERYAGCAVQPDLLRIMLQVERMAARAGAR